jgi:hypothetical protein
MSHLPTSDFSKLTIGNMPTTRGQSRNLPQEEQDTEERSDSEHDDDDDDEEGDDEEDRVPVAPSGLNYDIAQLSPNSQDRVKTAWEGASRGDFHVDRYMSHNRDEPGEYYAYQISEITKERFSVRIGDSKSPYSQFTCTCSDTKTCRHLYYLLDQIASKALSVQQQRSTLVLTNKGYPAGVPDPYTQIKEVGIDTLAQHLGWRQKSSDIPPGRIKEVREIMASFSPKLADNYKPDVFEDYAENESYEPVLAPYNLEDTVTRLLITEEAIFKRFREMVNVDYCASDRFKKLGDKAESAIKTMESYRPAKKSTDNEKVFDVVWCGKILLEIVDLIGKAIDRQAPIALNRKTKEDAAGVLVNILTLVIRHDEDMYAASGWAGTPQRSAPAFKHSLYQFLIVARPKVYFVIDYLEQIADVAGLSAYALEDVSHELKAHTDQPRSFLAKLQSVVETMKQAPGSKRSGSRLEGSSKRMKARSPRRSSAEGK